MIAHLPDTTAIRLASATRPDAQALVAVEHTSLGDSAYTPEEMLAIIARPEQYVYLAWSGEQAVGFCACFETRGGTRLEVDMLGVLPEWRGRRIARRLIARALEEARARGVRGANAVVAIDNAASQRAFEHAGLVGRAQAGIPLVHAMLVYACQGYAPQSLPPGCAMRLEPEGQAERLSVESSSGSQGACCLLPVQTLSYRGLWVESLQAPTAQAQRCLARAAAERAKQLALDEVGYLAPQPDVQPVAHGAPRGLPWVREGYRDLGDYWIYEVALT